MPYDKIINARAADIAQSIVGDFRNVSPDDLLNIKDRALIMIEDGRIKKFDSITVAANKVLADLSLDIN